MGAEPVIWLYRPWDSSALTASDATWVVRCSSVSCPEATVRSRSDHFRDGSTGGGVVQVGLGVVNPMPVVDETLGHWTVEHLG